MHRYEVSSWFRFCVRLGLKVSVRAVNMTQMHFLSHHAQLFSPKTAGHSIIGPPSDILEFFIRTDPSQVNTLITHYSKSAKKI